MDGQPAFATIFTPQGDGNIASTETTNTTLLTKFATIFTPQGDGNPSHVEGPELFITEIRHDIYPARGRKLSN